MDKLVILTGFAIFTMFFGSGNLVFPIMIGVKSHDSCILSSIGLLLLEGIFPIIGLIALIRFNGSTELFFKKLGAIPSFLIVFLTLLILGPMGVVPRSMWVGYGGLQLLGAKLSFFPLFAIIFSIVLGICTWKKDKILDILAVFFTPLKFGSLILVMIAGIIFAPSLVPQTFKFDSFVIGVKYGYQMVDLLGSVIFAESIVKYIKQKRPYIESKEVLKLSIQSSIIGGVLLSVVYICLLLLGAAYSKELSSLESHKMLPYIAEKTLGKNFGLSLMSFVLNISCLATCMILIHCFVEFVRNNLLKFKIKTSYELLLIGSLVFSVSLSLSGFMSIFRYLDKILEIIYPIIMIYTVYSFFVPAKKKLI